MTALAHVPDDYWVTVIRSGQLAISYLTDLVASGFPTECCSGLQRNGPRQRFAVAEYATSLDGVEWTSDLGHLPLDVVVLAVKPKNIGATARSMTAANRRPSLLLSTASISQAELTAAFASSVTVVRCMPHFGAAVWRSSTLVWPYFELTSEFRRVVDRRFGVVGNIWSMASEEDLAGSTALAGAGIAYVVWMTWRWRMPASSSTSTRYLGPRFLGRSARPPGRCWTPGGQARSAHGRGGMTRRQTERALEHLDCEGLDQSAFETTLRSLNIHQLEAKIGSVAK